MVGEVAGGYRPAGDVQPPLFPLARGLGRLLGGQQVVPAGRALPGLLDQQAEGVPVLSSGGFAFLRRSAQ